MTPKSRDPIAQMRLMKAAPNLLAALKDARGVLESCRKDAIGTPTETFFQSKLRACDVAIAEAEK